jgi:hypothetical protein
MKSKKDEHMEIMLDAVRRWDAQAAKAKHEDDRQFVEFEARNLREIIAMMSDEDAR